MNPNSVEQGVCELCKRQDSDLTRHHLIPRATHRKTQTRKRFDREELSGRLALLCRACHKFIHKVLSEKQLASDYHSVEQLLQHPEIAKFVRWVSTKPPGLRVQIRAPRRSTNKRALEPLGLLLSRPPTD